MADNSPSYVLLYRAAFALLCILILFAHLLPLDTLPRSWGSPDLMMAMCFAWAVRRPDFVPVVLVAAVFLLADVLLLRGPGFWAALVVIASEYLRAHAVSLRDVPFPFEFATVAGAMAICFVVYRIGLSILFVEQAQLSIFLTQALSTILIYPIVVAVSHFVLGVRKTSASDVNTLTGRT